MSLPETTISIYENDVPAFADKEMARLYGTLESSLAYLRIYFNMERVNTYVARKGDQVVAVFLYQRIGRQIQILNRGMTLDPVEIERFARHLFMASGPIDMLVFPAVQVGNHPLAFLNHRTFCTEDTILALPESVEAYLAKLGASTRKNIKRHHNRLARMAPSFCYQVYEKDRASEQQIRAIIEWNHARMAGKNKISAINEQEIKRIGQLVKECGVVAVATIEGRLCAGAIMFQVGNNYISRVNAHDPQYDEHRLGTLCCYLAICECIRRGGHRFHFMSGKEEYKCALMGTYSRLEAVVVYRSLLCYLLDGRNVMMRLLYAHTLAANRWLLDRASRQDSAIDRFASAGVKGLRKIFRLVKASFRQDLIR